MHSVSTQPIIATRPRAILLLGPTGSGKTPLGELLERRGLWGHDCHHFDFGGNLREFVAGGRPDEWIAASEIDFLRRVLESGALLEDEHFPLAARILDRFLAVRQVGGGEWLVLNGLPRHVGQAEALADVVQVDVVVCLECTPDAVSDRIRTNAGGDRAERSDDSPAAIARKLAIFATRTAPLLEHYRQRGARIEVVSVGAETGPEDVWRALAESTASDTRRATAG